MAMNETLGFREGDAPFLRSNKKMATFRLPDGERYLYQRGQPILAICGNVTVPITICDTHTQQLKDIPKALWGMNGFFDIKTAVDEMRAVGGRYQNVTKNTKFTWIAHISSAKLEKLSSSAREALLAKPTEQWLRNSELIVDLLGPAITYWATEVRHMSKPALKRFMEKNLPL